MDFGLDDANWGDEATLGKEAPLPPPSEEGPDENGIKRMISYRKNEKGQVEKVVRTFRIQTIQRRVPLAVVERRAKWKKFGQAATAAGQENITYPSFEEVRIEKPDAAEKSALEKLAEARQAAGADAAAGGAGGGAGGSMVVCRRCGGAHWTLSCPYKDLATMPAAGAAGAAGGAGASPAAAAGGSAGGLGGGAGGAAGASTAKYVAPRKLDAKDGVVREVPLEELTQLRVSNLSEDAEEDDVRRLFAPFGRLDKVFVAKNRETNQPRGFAFVRFMRHDDAAAAMKAIDGLPFLHLILRVEWSKPSTNDRGGAPGAVAAHHYTGYGKKLAQDIVKPAGGK